MSTTTERQDQAHSGLTMFMAALVNSSNDAIFGTDLEGRIISANPTAERLSGYSMKELIGSRIRGATAPESWREVHATIERARVEGTALHNVEVPVRSKDGVLRDLSMSFAPVFEAGGKLIGSVITMRDQTELNAAREQLLQSERLAATGQMVSAIAHESRNALQRIQIGVDLLGLELPENSDSWKDLDRISRAKDDLQHMFEELRTYAGPLNLEHQRCSVANVWRQAWSSLESARVGHGATLIEQTRGVSFQLAFGISFWIAFEPPGKLEAYPTSC